MGRAGFKSRIDEAAAPLRRFPVFRRYLAARLVSQTGSSAAPIALAFAVLEIGGQAATIGLVLTAALVPQMLLMLAGGAIADRAPRDRIMVIAHLVSAATQLVVAVLLLTGRAEVWHLLAAAVLSGAVGGFVGPAAEGMVRQLVAKDHLREANATQRMVQNVVKVAAPALAGVGVAAAGAGWVLAYDAVTFLVAAWLLSRLRVPLTPIKRQKMWAALREGWADFASRRWLWIMVVQSALCCAPWLVGYQILGPVYTQEYLGGAAAWGLVMAVFSGGLIAGSVVVLLLRPRRVAVVACVAIACEALPLAALALHAPLPVLLAAVFLTGVGLDVSINTFAAFRQREIPLELQSRVAAYNLVGQQLLIPVGYLVAAPLADAVGLVPVLAGCAAVIVVCAFVPLLDGQVRAMRLPRVPAAPGGRSGSLMKKSPGLAE
ncbi:MFS transporter [Actinocorallia libanotica]|uniref:MFS transporter n=1 Tax=Actinocorallia libanotica TaxID=46162 RepID=A0ABP4BWA6_9ACTN